ncbi:MAG: GatB/YqeY domain-containing protein [Smithellaceae bacterium]|nr:GatB/YqeY domain-containing protein [Smithellaceae bacterium]
MDISEKITQQMAAAAKAQDKLRLSALRMIKTALHNREIDLHRAVNESEFVQLLSQMAKQRKDSIEQFEKGGRADLVAKETAELAIIQEFLPAQLSEAEIGKVIDEAIAEVGATSSKDMGKVMKAVMPKLAARADGKLVGDLVKARLSA